ncbi:MAG TPA: class I SAM-dependent methyltransferase [Noviherbaspirillum sp.]|nr:class I SAM-dependent methyltransferase [Noviherbaspirillum sp.]
MNKKRSGAASIRSAALLRAPAIQAGLIQACCFIVVLGVAQAATALSGAQMTIAVAALLQGALAAVVSRLRGLESWWLVIQLLFPMALVMALSLQLPPAVPLIAFVALLGWYWSTFRTQVPFYPSGLDAWQAVEGLLPNGRPIRFIDIGSGLGGLVLHLSGKYRQSEFTGIEIAPLPWFVSRLRARLKGSRASFIRGDYSRVDFAGYDVVFAYLSPAAMQALWKKANAEMRPGSLLLSYEFDIPGVMPQLTSRPVDNGPLLYGWYMQPGKLAAAA